MDIVLFLLVALIAICLLFVIVGMFGLMALLIKMLVEGLK